jgi:hypothetical protein
MNSNLRQGQVTEFKNIKVPTRHGNICVCGNGVINRHAKGTEIRSRYEVVDETAMTGVYLKLVRRRQETSIREHQPTIPPSRCLATHPQIDCNPKSTSSFAHTLQGDAGHCSMQGSSIEHRASQQHSTGESMSLDMTYKEPVQTEYLFTSSFRLTTEAIFDMA